MVEGEKKRASEKGERNWQKRNEGMVIRWKGKGVSGKKSTGWEHDGGANENERTRKRKARLWKRGEMESRSLERMEAQWLVFQRSKSEYKGVKKRRWGGDEGSVR